MRRTKLAFLICCVALTVGVFLFYSMQEDRASCGVSLIAAADAPDGLDAKALRAKRASDGVLLLDGKHAPYDAASSTYYLPQDCTTDGFIGSLEWSKPGMRAYLAAVGFDSEAVASGRRYTLFIVDGQRYFTENVVFTGLPALVVRIEQDVSYVFDKELPAGTVDLFSCGDAEMFSCYATIRVRGNLSATLPKVPYRLTLYDRDGKRLLSPLLGLPESDEWILNAMYSEPSRVRDKLALDTWNAISALNPAVNPPTASMEYVELFYGDAYMGLYGLMNPVDGQTLSLSENDVLFKASEWETPSAEDLAKYSATLDGGTTGVSVKWPKTLPNDAIWKPMIAYVRTFYDERGSVPENAARKLMCEENLVDYALFFLVTTPRDNYFSNTYFLVRTDSDGERRITKIPWDLNCTFGNRVTATTRTHCKQNYGIEDEPLFPDDVETLLAQDAPGLFDALSSRYAVLRKTVFSEEAMLERLYRQVDEITLSGALGRELARWPEGDQQPDVTPIADFIEENLRALDTYFSVAPGKENALGIPS